MKKLLGIILSVILIITPMSAVFVSAAPLTPSMPSNATVILDKDGVSKTLGDNGDWRANWWEGRFSKNGLAAADFTDADFVEFDIKYSDYSKFASFVNDNNVTINLHLTSDANPWGNRSGADIMKYGTDIGNGWYHYRIPKIEFVFKQNAGVQWNAVNFWFLYSDNSNVPFGEICSETLTIANICGTVGGKPALPENSIVIDETGKSVTVGDYYQWLGDRSFSVGEEADLSDAEYIEFDMCSNKYEALKVPAVEKALAFELLSDYKTTNNMWAGRTCVFNIFKYEVSADGIWHHFRIPKSAFSYNDGGTWENKDAWRLSFWGGANESTGDIASANIEIINLCGTVLKAPELPSNTVAVLDKDGLSNTLGDHGDWTANWYYNRFIKSGINSADFSKADFIEFDVFYSNYNAFKSYIENGEMTFGLHLTSANGPWGDRSGADIMSYGTLQANGWYHYQIPKTAFYVAQYNGVDWSSVNCWFLFGEGSMATLGDICSDTLTIANICATAAEKPALPAESIVIDQNGLKAQVGDQYNWMWDRLIKGNDTVDLTSAEYIEFDLKCDMYDALKAAGKEYVFTLVLVSDYSVSGNKWSSRHCALGVFDYEIGSNGDWHHFVIPKSGFWFADEGADWSDKDLWMFGFWGGVGESTESLASANIEVINLCGTAVPTVFEKEDNTPEAPINAIAVLDADGADNSLGDNGDWQVNWYEGRFCKYNVTAADFSGIENVEFDIHYSNYENFRAHIKNNNISFALHLTSSGQAWADRSAAEILDYGTDMGNGWYHYVIPKTVFIVKQDAGVDWTNVNSWFLFGENVNVALGGICADTLRIVNICGTSYSLADKNYTVNDGYAIVPQGLDVAAVTTATNKVYTANGSSAAGGKLTTGMTVNFELDGWVYDSATVVVDNDVDGDGMVSAADLVLTKKFLFELAVADEIQNVALTGSKTAAVSVIDYIQMKKALIK